MLASLDKGTSPSSRACFRRSSVASNSFSPDCSSCSAMASYNHTISCMIRSCQTISIAPIETASREQPGAHQEGRPDKGHHHLRHGFVDEAETDIVEQVHRHKWPGQHDRERKRGIETVEQVGLPRPGYRADWHGLIKADPAGDDLDMENPSRTAAPPRPWSAGLRSRSGLHPPVPRREIATGQSTERSPTRQC